MGLRDFYQEKALNLVKPFFNDRLIKNDKEEK